MHAQSRRNEDNQTAQRIALSRCFTKFQQKCRTHMKQYIYLKKIKKKNPNRCARYTRVLLDTTKFLFNDFFTRIRPNFLLFLLAKIQSSLYPNSFSPTIFLLKIFRFLCDLNDMHQCLSVVFWFPLPLLKGNYKYYVSFKSYSDMITNIMQ